MEETVFYISLGNPKDKQSLESFALATSTRTSHQHASFRNADCPRNGAVLTGVGAGERVFTAATNKALLNIYTWGKESPDQKIPVPEQLSCLALVPHPEPSIVHRSDTLHKLPSFRIPWLLAAGSKSGKLYIWELASGNLLCVKESHYQEVSTLQFSSCGTFIISGGLDARIIIWRTLDLISLYNGSDEDASIKPFHTITDNSLPITDLKISQSNNLNDLKLYTASRDGTLRVYDLFTKQLLTTFVLSSPIECLGKDPANRSLYVGLDNGTIRSIPLYRLNKNTSVLESIGGNSKIITLENDPELKETFVHHQQSVVTAGEETQVSVTKLDVSFDGMNIISGDSLGRVYVSDIVTKQILKSFNVCSGPISYIQVSAVTEDLNNQGTAGRNDKKHRLIPQLKRVLASTDAVEHQLYLEIPGPIVLDVTEDFDAWILAKSNEEFEFRNLSSIKSTVKKVTPIADNSKVADLQEKLDKVSQAYTELRMKHEELFNEHNKLLHSS